MTLTRSPRVIKQVRRGHGVADNKQVEAADRILSVQGPGLLVCHHRLGQDEGDGTSQTCRSGKQQLPPSDVTQEDPAVQ